PESAPSEKSRRSTETPRADPLSGSRPGGFRFSGAPDTSGHEPVTWPTVGGVSQLSFFTAEAVPPAVADLSGVLAASGQIVLVGAPDVHGARLSVVVDEMWRAAALAEMIREAGLFPEIGRTDEDTPLVRTAVNP